MNKYYVVLHDDKGIELIPVEYETFKKEVLDLENRVFRMGCCVWVYSIMTRSVRTVLGFEVKE